MRRGLNLVKILKILANSTRINRRRPQAPPDLPTSVTPKIAAFSEAAIFGPAACSAVKVELWRFSNCQILAKGQEPSRRQSKSHQNWLNRQNLVILAKRLKLRPNCTFRCDLVLNPTCQFGDFQSCQIDEKPLKVPKITVYLSMQIWPGYGIRFQNFAIFCETLKSHPIPHLGKASKLSSKLLTSSAQNHLKLGDLSWNSSLFQDLAKRPPQGLFGKWLKLSQNWLNFSHFRPNCLLNNLA